MLISTTRTSDRSGSCSSQDLLLSANELKVKNDLAEAYTVQSRRIRG